MRGHDPKQPRIFSYLALYARIGRPSIPPERLLRALLLQLFYSIRSERLLIEQLDYNLLLGWFVGRQMTKRPGTMRHSARTASGCSAKKSPASSSAGCWSWPGPICPTSTSRWTAR